MRINVTFSHHDGTTDQASFSCADASRKMFDGGRTGIVFRGEPAAIHLETGHQVRTVLFAHASVVFTYDS